MSSSVNPPKFFSFGRILLRQEGDSLHIWKEGGWRSYGSELPQHFECIPDEEAAAMIVVLQVTSERLSLDRAFVKLHSVLELEPEPEVRIQRHNLLTLRSLEPLCVRRSRRAPAE
jgi:hypothetical protein